MNLFLNTHSELKKFAKAFLEYTQSCTTLAGKASKPLSWTVICERSSDISNIRKQLIAEINSISANKLSIIGGLSFYSLDQLGSIFCSLIAANHDSILKEYLPSSLSKPYINKKKQEHVVQFILKLFHISAQDTLPIARQLLVLLDTPLPQDVTLVDALMNALNLKKKRSYKDISTVLLKQILASFQATRFVLNRYSRFQRLVDEFFSENFWKGFETNEEAALKLIPTQLLSGSILWVSAPEYCKNNGLGKSFRPGEFIQTIVDDCLEFILKIRSKLKLQENSIFIRNNTILNTSISTSDIKSSGQFEVFTAANSRHFYRSILEKVNTKDKNEITFLAEFDANMYQYILHNASGTYTIADNEIAAWKAQDTNNFFYNTIQSQIHKKYDEFLNTASYIENYSKLSEIAKIYSIPIRELSDEQLNDMFSAYLKNESFTYSENNPFENIPKAFSFFPNCDIPEILNSVWSQNYFEQSSLATRLLNQIFTLFQTQGVEIENPCSENEFILYWKHIASLIQIFPNIKIRFFLENKEILEKFPIQFHPNQLFSLENTKIPNWTVVANQLFENQLLKTNFEKIKIFFDQVTFTSISTTQFETFIQCPFKFFLEHSLAIKFPQESQSFVIDSMALGTRVHKVCEQIISQMVCNYGNDGYLLEAPRIYQAVLDAIKPENIFLSPQKNTWSNAIKDLSDAEKKLFDESFSEIFEHQATDTLLKDEDELSQTLTTEMLKRTFFKFLKTEIELINSGQKLRVGTAREYPFSIQIGPLTIRGCIDRIDLNKDGYEIIDYKVSPISKSIQHLCLLPSEFLAQKKNKKLSIQGAVYSLAFGKNAFEQNIKENSILCSDFENKLSGFSLYRLKNIKDDVALLSYTFAHNSGSNESGVDQIARIESELLPYADHLYKKEFFPKPLDKKYTCQYCSFKILCPYPTQQGYQL